MMGKRINPKSALAPNISCANGIPIANVFLTEQNRAATKSSLSSLAALEIAQTNNEIVVESAITPASTSIVSPMP